MPAPTVRSGWQSLTITSPDRSFSATPFGLLWQPLRQDVDLTRAGSVVFEMNQVAVQARESGSRTISDAVAHTIRALPTSWFNAACSVHRER